MTSQEADLSAAFVPSCRELSAIHPAMPFSVVKQRKQVSFMLPSMIGTPERESCCQGLSVHPGALSNRVGTGRADKPSVGIHIQKGSAELASVSVKMT